MSEILDAFAIAFDLIFTLDSELVEIIRRTLIVSPSAVVIASLYLARSRSGPLGFLGILFPPSATASIEAIVAEIHASGAKIVMTTHDLAQARRLADDVVFLHRGRVAEQTPADAFFASPRSQEAASSLKGELAW